jgi:hypothetical protein
MKFALRLKAAIEHHNFNPNTFSKAMGLKHNALVYKFLDEEKEALPTMRILNQMLDALPDINPSWLLRGEGKMLKDKKESLREYRDVSSYMDLLNEAKAMIPVELYTLLLKGYLYQAEKN